MDAGIYEAILLVLKKLPDEKVLEAKHFIDFLEEQDRRCRQGFGLRFTDLCDPPNQEDDMLNALLETASEGYQLAAHTARAARS